MTSLKRYDPDIVVRKRLEKMMTDMVDRKPLRKAQLLKIKEQTTSIFKMDPEFLPKQESKKFNSAFENVNTQLKKVKKLTGDEEIWTCKTQFDKERYYGNQKYSAFDVFCGNKENSNND